MINTCPAEFATYHNYVRSLRFEEKPDYDLMRGMFQEVFKQEGYRNDYIFDWVEVRRAEVEESGNRPMGPEASDIGTPQIASSGNSTAM